MDQRVTRVSLETLDLRESGVLVNQGQRESQDIMGLLGYLVFLVRMERPGQRERLGCQVCMALRECQGMEFLEKRETEVIEGREDFQGLLAQLDLLELRENLGVEEL